jgi:[acyl-carrier-protein] S-malonyltransferase
MQSAVPAGMGAMAAIIGLPDERVAELCRAGAGDETVAPANWNGAGQVVVAGHRNAVRRVTEQARAAGGRALELAVSAPFHCALMGPAAEGLAAALADVAIAPLQTPVVTNVEARLNQDPGRVRELLIAQVTAPVRWGESMQVLRDLGCLRAFEVGPGQVLTKLLQRMRLGIDAVAVGEGERWAALAGVA